MKAGPQPEDGDSEDEGSANEADGLATPATDAFNGILRLSGASSISQSKKDKGKAAAVEVEDEAEGAPTLVNPDLPNLQSVLDKADVVIELLDARDPMSYRSSQLEELVAGKENQKLLLVLNKIGALQSYIRRFPFIFVNVAGVISRHMSSRICVCVGLVTSRVSPYFTLPFIFRFPARGAGHPARPYLEAQDQRQT